MKPLAFRLVPYKPRFRFVILSATKSRKVKADWQSSQAPFLSAFHDSIIRSMNE